MIDEVFTVLVLKLLFSGKHSWNASWYCSDFPLYRLNAFSLFHCSSISYFYNWYILFNTCTPTNKILTLFLYTSAEVISVLNNHKPRKYLTITLLFKGTIEILVYLTALHYCTSNITLMLFHPTIYVCSRSEHRAKCVYVETI